MAAQGLTKEQEAFLDECQLEFSDRYTESDVEYKKTYDAEIPPPPIMYPWYGRPKLIANRDRAGGSNRSGSGYREHRHENNYRDRDRDRDGDRRHDNRRYRPY